MALAEDINDVEKLYEYGERLNEAKDKSKHESDYIGIIAAAKGSSKAKQLAAQLIPRFFKHFPSLSAEAINAHFDLCEEDELGFVSADLDLRVEGAETRLKDITDPSSHATNCEFEKRLAMRAYCKMKALFLFYSFKNKRFLTWFDNPCYVEECPIGQKEKWPVF